MKSVEEIKEMYTELTKALQERAEADKHDISVFSVARFGNNNLSMVVGNGSMIAESLTHAITKMPVEANMAVLGAVVIGCANHDEMKDQLLGALSGLSELVQDIISDNKE